MEKVLQKLIADSPNAHHIVRTPTDNEDSNNGYRHF